jgi:hypothetical protein
VAAAQERETPAMDPAEWTRLKAQQTAQVEAGRQARREASARLTPVTDAEIARYGADHQPEASAGPEPEPDTGMAEVRQSVDAAAEAGARAPDREAERVAEINAVGENEPTAHERQAEPEIEPSWRHGEAGSYYEPEAWRAPEPVAEIEDVEPEMEA